MYLSFFSLYVLLLSATFTYFYSFLCLFIFFFFFYFFFFFFFLVFCFYFFFFFFQAEDGIRDKLVTGVQTCALPIFLVSTGGLLASLPEVSPPEVFVPFVLLGLLHEVNSIMEIPVRYENVLYMVRSEERRVGKECRSWWSSYH